MGPQKSTPEYWNGRLTSVQNFGNGAVMFPLSGFVEKTLQMLHQIRFLTCALMWIMYHFSFNVSMVLGTPRGVLPNKEVRGLGPHIKFGGKIWGKVRPSLQNKRKNLESSVTKRSKSWEKVPILGSYLKFRGQNLAYLSFILLEAKFGAPTRISETKFGAKPPSRPPNMEVPLWVGTPRWPIFWCTHWTSFWANTPFWR